MQNPYNSITQHEFWRWSNRQIVRQSAFARDVRQGLSSDPKYLHAKYLYDDTGSRIFQDIMSMPEYYLTDCEYEIFEQQKSRIADLIFNDNTQPDIIELGAGDGLKTRVLLNYFLDRCQTFQYVPIDISGQAIRELTAILHKECPRLTVKEMVGDYFEMMRELNHFDHNPRVILFLGSNIGNYSHPESSQFLNSLHDVMHERDKLLIGFDLKKNPYLVHDAYNDPHGHTWNFNLNLLQRINNTLEADFNLKHFQHYENYDPQSGTAKSFLISTRDQRVNIGLLEITIQFRQWETILVERSQKFDMQMIESLAAEHGFKIIAHLFDSKGYFCNSIWEPVYSNQKKDHENQCNRSNRTIRA